MTDPKAFIMREAEASCGQGKKRGADGICLPEVSFSTFVLSLNASALVHLGVLENPETGQKQPNLAMGKQTIDILALLEEKTRGNLSADEEGLLKNLLYDLRLIYVREKR
jgi:hypothetical protein